MRCGRGVAYLVPRLWVQVRILTLFAWSMWMAVGVIPVVFGGVKEFVLPRLTVVPLKWQPLL